MGTIITCGVYGFTAENFENAVVKARPDIFVDVRRRRGVRGKQYSFANSKRLQAMLKAHDIPYIHKVELAPPEEIIKREGEVDKEEHIARHHRDHLSEEFVADYTSDVLKSFVAKAFIESLGDVKRVLLLCVEKTPDACHRGLLAAEISKQLDWKREDIIAEE